MKNIRFFARLSAAYHNRAEPENLRRIAEESWRVLVVFAVLVAFLSCGFGLWKLASVSRSIQQVQNQTSTQNATALNTTRLNAATQALSARTNDFDSLAAQSASSTVPDPYTN